jgi:GT2 family glycosyltransferase/glycosyltransferase involved in cell wall biosynthesis
MRKKILFLSHSSELYGAERVLLQVLTSLSRKEFQPFLVLPRRGPFLDEAKKLAVETFVVPSKWWLTEKAKIWKQPFSWLWNIKCIFRIARLIKQKNIDLVYSNSAVNFCGALAARWHKVPHVWSIHEILGREDAPLGYLFGKRALLSLLSALSTRIIVYSEAAGQPFRNKEKVCLVPMGFKWSLGERGLKEMLRQKFGLSKEDYVIGTVGKIYPEKGQDKMVESIDLLQKDCPGIKLLIVGDVGNRRYFDRIKRFVSTRNLEKHVIFAGYQPDISGILSLMDLLVIPSSVESFGRVAVEAISVQVPVLVVRKGAAAEIVEAGENGFLVDSPDPPVLAEAIRSIRENPQLARRVAEKGSHLVREKYAIERQMEKTEGIIRESLGQGGHEKRGESALGHEIPSVSIIIVNYNNRAYLLKTLGSLFQDKKVRESEVFVVDNASDDDSVGAVQRDFPAVRVIALPENIGYGGANNRGVEQASGEYLLFLNSDTSVPEGAVGKLLEIIKDRTEYGIVAPLILNPDRSLQLSWGSDLHFHTEVFLKYFAEKWHRLRFKRKKGRMSRNVDWVSGACFVIARSLFQKVGGFDERFFLYAEDADLGRRIRKLGYEVHLASDVRIVHYLGQSVSQVPGMVLLEAKRSQLHYYCKHNSRGALAALKLYLLCRFRLKRWLGYKGDGKAETYARIMDMIREFCCEDPA